MKDNNILFTSRHYKDHHDFWQRQLSLLGDGFSFNPGLKRSREPAAELQSYEFELGEDARQAITRLANNQDLGTVVVLLAAFMYLLYRFSDHEVVCVKSPLLNKGKIPDGGDDEVLLVAKINGNGTIKELLAGIGRTVAESYRYQSFPQSLVLAEDVLRDWQPTNVSIRIPGLHQTRDEEVAADLVLETVDNALGAIRLLYNPALFDEQFIQGFAGAYQQLLTAFADPNARLAQVDLVSAAEKQRLLVDFNETWAPYARDKTVHELFEEIVLETPEAIAVICRDRQLTYGQLNETANRLAHYLREVCHVRPNDRVGLLAERSERAIIALLAILKAGGSYVPVEPASPSDRIERLLDDAGARALLIDSDFLGAVENLAGPIFALDLQLDGLEDYRASNPPSVNAATDLIYVMFTSGSAGRPKGVEITHRGVVRLVRGANYVRLDAREVVLQMAPLSFDASTFEIWGALLSGARLVVLPETRPSLEELAQALSQHDVSTLWLTAGLFHLVTEERLETLRPVRQLLAGGDALSVAHVQKVLRELPGCTLINGYGPTESTTFACCYPMSRDEVINGTVPIGRPIANTEAYVFDRHLQPVPAGVPGELYLGGDGLARGYLNLPELTAEKFIPHPLSQTAGARLYRSGDLVRHLADGKLEFLGRHDNQVKLRGFRVEPGEVEALLSGHTSVSAAIVLVEEDQPRQKRLVAYVVSSQGQPAAVDELRSYLLDRLPDYLVPAAFVLLERFPLTANGKIDRRALPALASTNGHENSFAAPRTAEEQTLADCWGQVLGRGPIGIDDNFFALGGDSIHAIQVVSRAGERGLTFSIHHLFQHQTIRELAAALKSEEFPVESAPAKLPFELIGRDDHLKLAADVEDSYPLTMLQLGMLFHSEYSPQSSVYHDVLSLKLGARLEVESLEAVMGQLIARHAVLRTSFDLTSFSEPLQLVQRAVTLPLSITDLEGLSADEQDEVINAFVKNERQVHFDWTKAPLLRWHLHRRDSEAFQLTLSFHHAILDGWSLATLLTELLQLYKSRLQGEVAAIEPAPANAFRDYVALERETLSAPEAREFWGRKLNNFTINELTGWSAATGRRETREVGVFEFDLPADVSVGLRSLSKLAAVPLKSVLLAAHLKVLSLLAREFDVLTGVVSHGRPESSDGERAMGLFLNTLPFRKKLLGGTWLELVREVFEDERQSLAFGRYPLARIQNDFGGVPLFKTAFNFVHFHVYQALRQIAEVEILEASGSQQTNFVLTANFQMDAFSELVRLSLDYDANELTRLQVERIGEYYQSVLRSIASDPKAKYESVSLLSEAEEREQLVAWNGQRVEYRRESRVEELFAEQAERRSEAVALVTGVSGGAEGEAGSEQVSYGELNERANRLAHYLRRRGVGPEVVVGVCLERSVELIVSLLGILKAGGAYLPLDPEYPESRRVYMMRDAGARVLLTSEKFAAGLGQELVRELGSAVAVVSLERAAAELAAESSANPERQGRAENLAYVMYTSGSTGAPKGIGVTHRNVLRLVSNANYVELGEEAVVAQAATVSFDASTFEIWGALLHGGRLVGVSRGELLTPGELGRVLREQEVSVLFLTTALFNEVVRQEPTALAGVKQVLFGGEQVDVEIVRRLVAGSSKPERLKHVYGPTETTTYATWCEVEEVREGAVTIPIGRAIGNTEAYVLDGRQQLAPVGVVGELYLGGDGLARGYLGAAALTAERFVPHPYSMAGGARLYRTGDLVRYDREGQLEFVGRVDEQLKIRGYRIEPGEVESALRGHESVSEAVVLGRAEENGEKRLVAYVAAAAGAAELSVTELRSYLGGKLPEYMLPAAFVYLAELPLNANGKVDRGALPAPEWQRLAGEREYVGPRTATEEVLCGIWAEVLRVERVGVYDNFFELGGDSILSIQIVAKARQRGLQLSPKQLFQYQRVADLAAQVKQSELGDAPQGEVTGSVALTPIQHWFFEQELPRVGHWNQALLLESEAQLSVALLEQSWRELVKHHDGLRRRYRCEDGVWRQEIRAATAADVVVDSYELAGLEAAEQRQVLQERADELQGRLELEQGPLVRVAWFGRGAAGGWLLVIIHHLVVDGVSWRILLEDFAMVYEQLRAGAAVALPAKTNSVQQWGEQVTAYAQSEAVAAEAEYWLRAGAVQVKPLPRDYEEGREGGGNEEERAGLESGSLTAAETQALLQEVPGRYQTQITEVLVTGLVEAVWKWSGERLVRLALEGHGREAVLGGELDVTRTVGWFTTLYPVVVDLRQVYETGAALKAVKEQLRGIPQRGTGYGVLRYLREAEGASLSEQAEAELSFNYLGQFDQVLSETQWLRAAAEGSGVARYGGGQRRYLLDVSSSVVGGQLQVSVHYSTAIHERETMARLLTEYLTQLRRIIAHCQGLEVVEYSPSDFPQARLSQRDLDKLMTRLGKGKISKQQETLKPSDWQASS